MKSRRHHLALFASVIAVSAWAQSSPQPLNLKLPSESVPVAAAAETSESSTSAPAAAPDASTQPNPMPSAMYYDDANPRNRVAGAPACDDSTYNQLQVHGSVGAGVVGGNHISGNYQDAVINVSKPLGSCDNPTGDVSFSLGVSKGKFNDSRRHGRWQH